MDENIVATVTFLYLAGAGLGAMVTHRRLPLAHLPDDTNATVRHVADLFVVMASLVLGLTLNSTSGTFQAVDHNVHAYATDVIPLDRTVRALGPEADETHRRLAAYVQRALSESNVVEGDRQAERLLDDVGTSLRAIRVSDGQLTTIWNDAHQMYREIVRQRWVIIEQSEGTIPRPLIAVVITWLVLIFASFGYRAPRNGMVVTILVLAALLMAGTIYLMIDMELPASGFIRASDEPLQRVLAEIQP